MSKGKRRIHILSLLLMIVLIAADQLTKWLAVTKLKGRQPFVLIKGVLEFDYLENRGVAFGLFQNQRWPILIMGALLMAVVILLIIRLPEGRKYDVFQIILVCILAGGVGNMIDRLFLGYVVDFISFVLINYPIFNVADCYVVCATIAVFIMFLFVFREDELDFLSFKKSVKAASDKEE